MHPLWRLRPESYRGLLMRCAPGTHEAAFGLLSQAPVDGARARVLDLASGSGAFLRRLRDDGYTDLHAVELDAKRFGVEGIVPRAIDLNGDFASQLPGPYDLVTAIEIIEHLDAPRHFLRQVHALLSNGGHLLLTTPNVASWLGRIKFLLTGQLRLFDERQYNAQRHVSPITDVQMRLMLRERGFDLVEATTAGEFFGPLKRVVTAPVHVPMRLALGPGAYGDVAIYLARKTMPDERSGGRDPHYGRRSGPGSSV